jgi:hypothetical protein
MVQMGLLASSQMIEVFVLLLYLFQFENVDDHHRLHFVCFLIGRFVKLVAFLVAVAFVLQGFDVLPLLMLQQQQ